MFLERLLRRSIRISTPRIRDFIALSYAPMSTRPLRLPETADNGPPGSPQLLHCKAPPPRPNLQGILMCLQIFTPRPIAQTAENKLFARRKWAGAPPLGGYCSFSINSSSLGLCLVARPVLGLDSMTRAALGCPTRSRAFAFTALAAENPFGLRFAIARTSMKEIRNWRYPAAIPRRDSPPRFPATISWTALVGPGIGTRQFAAGSNRFRVALSRSRWS